MKARNFPVALAARSSILISLLASQAGAQSSRFEIAADESFDAESIAAYSGNHEAIYRHIDDHHSQHLENLKRWLRQPSVSAQNIGIQEMANLLVEDLKKLGFSEAALVPTDGHPGVWGYYDAGAEKTLIVYLMYDVQPVNPEDWRSPPFDAELVETELGTVLMARGATNQKGPERAFLNALESILAIESKLPVNIMVAAEGEEELGSIHYPQIIDAYEERLRTADSVFFPFNSQNPDGEAVLNLGVKGIIYFELEAVGGSWGGPKNAEIHGSYKAIVDAPALRLVQALASLTSEDGNTILVPGYYDDVRPPTPEEQRLINGVLETWNENLIRTSLGVEKWIDGISGKEALLRYLYEPTLNIDGIWGGYTGEGAKTILPHKATAKVDSRLPPNIRPEEALEKIRRHLDDRGFGDIVIRQIEEGYPASQTSVETEAIRATISVFNKYDHSPAVWPRLAGSAPFYQFTERLGLPLVMAGLGHGSGAHAPNEYMVIQPKDGLPIADLAEIERGYVDMLFALAGR
ncbi:MAG TPA: M20/M25/M40 family metallo-hydrolase [Vicinamibacteria bacterium]|nr:M20/M25/M40 family metallo-hydrolase [Vicinamibacteria bacterium]